MESEDKPLLNHEELTAFVAVLDVATLAGNGHGMTALVDLARLVDERPVHILGTVVGFLGASIRTLAEVSGKSVDEMAADLRRNGAL